MVDQMMLPVIVWGEQLVAVMLLWLQDHMIHTHFIIVICL